MEEIDHVLVRQLCELGCDIDESTRNFQDLTNEKIMEYALVCISHIDPNNYGTLTKFNHKTPINMARKFRLATDLANICNSLGYKTKLEYQTFLYGSTTEIRNLFLFLLERANREDATGFDSNKKLNNDPGDQSQPTRVKKRYNLDIKWLPMSPNDINSKVFHHKDLLFNTHYIINRRLWFSKPVEYKLTGREQHQERPDKSLHKRPPLAPRRKTVTINIKSTGVAHIVSLCEWNQLGCLENSFSESGTQFEKVSRSSDTVIETYMRQSNSEYLVPQSYQEDESHSQSKPSEISSIIGFQSSFGKDQTKEDDFDKGCATLTSDIEIKNRMEVYIEKKKSLIEQLTTTLDKLKSRHKELLDHEKLLYDLEREMKQTKKEYAELKTSSKPIEILRQDLTSLMDELSKYKADWAEARSLFEEEIAHLGADISHVTSSQKGQIRTKLQDIQSDIERKQMKIEKNYQIIAKLNDKQAIFKEQEHGPSRSAFVKMLNEVMKQSKKQNNELNKILDEIRFVQKDINTLSGRLQRSFILVDEAVFKGAKSDEWNRRCYKLLAAMHEECDLLIQGVQDTGEVVREIRQLEEMVDLEHCRGINDSLVRVAADLKIVKEDNKMYQERLLIETASARKGAGL